MVQRGDGKQQPRDYRPAAERKSHLSRLEAPGAYVLESMANLPATVTLVEPDVRMRVHRRSRLAPWPNQKAAS
jgi:hypothetical protein